MRQFGLLSVIFLSEEVEAGKTDAYNAVDSTDIEEGSGEITDDEPVGGGTLQKE